MLKTTLGQVLVNEALPEDMRDYHRELNGKAMRALLQQIANDRPEIYRQVSKNLLDVGRDVSYSMGGFSFGLQHLRQATIARSRLDKLKRALDVVRNDPKLDDDQRSAKIIQLAGRESKPLEEEVMKESLADKNPLAAQVLSGSRGKTTDVRGLRGADLLYTDQNDEVIPLAILRNYSQGLSPAEYFSGAFGARKGILSAKFAVRDAGYLGKILNQITHPLIVTANDEEDDRDEGDNPPNGAKLGLPVETDDPDNEGSLLSQSAGGYPRNTILTPKVLKDLQAKKVDRIIVRSPLVGGSRRGGLYARDVGVRERGGLAPIGDEVGIAAGQAISEPLSQGVLGVKHSGGVAGTSKVSSGFDYVKQLVEVPKVFPHGATHANRDGRVNTIEDAPAGGKYLDIDGEQHYIAAGYSPQVKVGQRVEAGDILSEGIPNPAEIVRHKGIGEGRRYFTGLFRQAIKDSGMTGHRRNIELLARGLINHVRLSEEMGEYIPDDIVPYDLLERSWQPRQGTVKSSLASAVGKYLERPVLHHTIGTKVQPSMLDDLKHFGIKEVEVHPDPPPFEPEMVRGMDNLSQNPDWLARMLNSNLKKNLLRGVHRGHTSDPEGVSYVPALIDVKSFNRKGLVRGFNPASIKKEIVS